MPKLNVTISDYDAAIIEERIQSGRYTTQSDYVRELIRNDSRQGEAMPLRDYIAEVHGLAPDDPALEREYETVSADLRQSHKELEEGNYRSADEAFDELEEKIKTF